MRPFSKVPFLFYLWILWLLNSLGGWALGVHAHAQASKVAVISRYRKGIDRAEQHTGITRVAIYDGVEQRHTEDEYARLNAIDLEELKAKLSSTVRIACNKFEVTGQVTGREDIVTTVSHLFFDKKTCQKISDPSSCTITYTFEAKTYNIVGAKLFDHGYKCPAPPEVTDDWAVLILSKPVVGPIPYRTPSLNDLHLRAKQPVIFVAAQSIDFCFHKTIGGRCKSVV